MGTPLRLCYILSSGRSGSTLLDSLLGRLPGVRTLGELQVLPFELAENRAPCGCGAALAECEFWGPLIGGLQLEHDGARLTEFRESHGTGRVLRREHLGDLRRGRVARSRMGSARAYAELNAELLERIAGRYAGESGARPAWLVDASKDPYRLLWLATSQRIELRVVHLLKDPRAFVHSITRDAPSVRPSAVLRYASRWAVENGNMARLGRALGPARYRRLSYETLAAEPEATLADLAGWLGLSSDGVAAAVGGAPLEHVSHAIAGNRMRWRAGGVALDERWRTDLPAWARVGAGAWTAAARRGLRGASTRREAA